MGCNTFPILGVYDEFVDAVTKIVRNFKQGAACKGTLTTPTITPHHTPHHTTLLHILINCLWNSIGGCYDCGSMTMKRQIEIVDELVQDAVNNGATLVAGGKRNEKLDGLFYEPTLLTNVVQGMRIVNEVCYIFISVMCVCVCI